MEKVFRFFVVASLIVLGSSCKKEDSAGGSGGTGGAESATLLIANEGISPDGTGSLSTYDPTVKRVDQNIFAKANVYTMGGSFASMLNHNNTIFAIISNRGEVFALNPEDFTVKFKASGFDSPRYMTHIIGNKYYITDWGINAVHVYNSKTNGIIKTVEVGIRPERMLLVNDTLVFITNSGGGPADSLITVMHANYDTVVTQLEVGHNPNSLVMASDSTVMVLSGGIEDQDVPINSTPGSISVINTDSLTVDTIMYFADNQLRPNSLVTNRTKDAFYFLDLFKGGSIMKYDPLIPSLPSLPFVTGSFNAIVYDQSKEEIYVSDPVDDISPGRVYRYDNTGALLDEFTVGIIPINFAFKQN